MTVKDRIKNAVLELNKEKDIMHITASEVSKKAQISRSTFYNYYDDVYSVMDEIENELIEGVGAIVEQYARYSFVGDSVKNPSLRDVKIYEFVEQHREAYKILYGPYGDYQFQRKVRRIKEKVVRQILNDTNINDAHKGIVSAFLVGGLMESIYEWIVNYPSIDAKTLERIVSSMLYREIAIQDHLRGLA